MNFENDDLVWNIIGEKKFCCFKTKTTLKNFCKHKLNISGFCSRQSCPLANSQYATIMQKEGVFYLVIKNQNNLNLPDKIWKKIVLSRNFRKAIQEINLNLAFWPKFFLYFAKLKLTRLTQIFSKFKLKELQKSRELYQNKKLIYFNRQKVPKNIKKIEMEKKIEIELLNRLNLGVYGNLYSLLPIQIEQDQSRRIKRKRKILEGEKSFPEKELNKI